MPSIKCKISSFFDWFRKGNTRKYAEVNRYINRLTSMKKVPNIRNVESWNIIKEELEKRFLTEFIPKHIEPDLNDAILCTVGGVSGIGAGTEDLTGRTVPINFNVRHPDKALVNLSFWINTTINQIIKEKKLPLCPPGKHKMTDAEWRRLVSQHMEPIKKRKKVSLDAVHGNPRLVRKYMKYKTQDNQFEHINHYPGLMVGDFTTDTKFDMTPVCTEEVSTWLGFNSNTYDPSGIYYSMLSDLDFIKPWMAHWYTMLLNRRSVRNSKTGYPSADNLCPEWRHTIVFMQSKKMDEDMLFQLNNYRPICLMLIMVKTYHRILSKRIHQYLLSNEILDNEIQKGMKGGFSGVSENIFLSRDIINDAGQSGQKLCMTFLDIQNAYGSVRYPFLDYVLKLYEVPDAIREYIISYYTHCTTHVYMMKTMTKPFQWRRGLFQGCTLSNVLFVSVMNVILRHLHIKFSDTHSYRFNSGAKMLMSAFMDDLMLVTPKNEQMNELLKEVGSIFSWAGFKLNANKTRLIQINQSQSENVHLFGNNITPLSPSEDFAYLGIKFDSTDNENRRAEILAKDVSGKLEFIDNLVIGKKHKLSNKDKFNMYNVHIAPGIRWQFMNSINNPLNRALVEAVERKYIEKWSYEGKTDAKQLIIDEKFKKRNNLIDSHIELIYRCSSDERIRSVGQSKYGAISDEEQEQLREKVRELRKLHDGNKMLLSYTGFDIDPLADDNNEGGFGAKSQRMIQSLKNDIIPILGEIESDASSEQEQESSEK